MDIEKTGAFIRTLRNEKKMTQKQLAEKLDCTDKAVSRWETGKGLPDAALLLPLCEQLGVSVNELLLGERITLSKSPDGDENALTASQLISKTDEAIVEIILQKDEQAKKLTKSTVMLLVLCCFQVIIFFGIPNIVGMINPQLDTAGVLVYATVINALLVGLLNGNVKWFFPIFTALLLLFVVPFAGSDDWLYGVFALWFLIGSAIVTGVSSLARLVFKSLRKAFSKS